MMKRVKVFFKKILNITLAPYRFLKAFKEFVEGLIFHNITMGD